MTDIQHPDIVAARLRARTIRDGLAARREAVAAVETTRASMSSEEFDGFCRLWLGQSAADVLDLLDMEEA